MKLILIGGKSKDSNVNKIDVSPSTVSLAISNTIQLTANVSPSNATNKSVTWTSSNETVASVDANGIVTGKTAGSATITASSTDGSNIKSNSVSVTVNVQ